MAGYVGQFMDQSTKLTQYVRNQLEKVGLWTNVPGGLIKIASSPGGYVWGYNSDFNIYSCKEPCTGDWAVYDRIPDLNRIDDVVADGLNVYFLADKRIAVRAVDGSGGWRILQPPPGDFSKLAVTDSFIFVDGYGCAKPCNTNTWVKASTGTIAAGSSGHVYSTYSSPTGASIVRRSDVSAQGVTEDLPGLKNVVPASTEADNTAIYGSNMVTKQPVRCTPPYESESSCKPLDTGGRKPTSLSVNPTTSTLYMTTVEPGPAGNIFQRLDTDNAPAVLDYSDNAVRGLDRDVNSLGSEIRVQNAEINAGNTLKEASEVIHEATNLHGPIQSTKDETQILRSQILSSSQDVSGYVGSLLPLQILVATLLLLFVLFAVVGFVLPTNVTAILAILLLSAGFGAAIYFVVKKQ
jgi:hypothetical protein